MSANSTGGTVTCHASQGMDTYAVDDMAMRCVQSLDLRVRSCEAALVACIKKKKKKLAMRGP